MKSFAVALAAVALLGTGSYVGYKIVEDPKSQLFGKTVVHGPTNERIVALTFDDGPNPPYTERILDVLGAEHVHATFFLVGRAVVAHPGTVRRIVRDGDAIGNHTWDHSHLLVLSRSQVRAELRRTDAALERVAGVRTRLMRPPFGARDFHSLAEIYRDGYVPIMWSVPLPKDWEQPGDATIARRIIEGVTPGAIVVLHDGNEGIVCGRSKHEASARVCDRSQEVAATREIVDGLRARGYRFVTIPELLAANRAVMRTADREAR